jgi:hypothetical protein
MVGPGKKRRAWSWWYQLLWIIIGALLTAIVYFATED